MYRNIIFDLGGVVVNFDPKNFLMERFASQRTEHRVYDMPFGRK